MQLLQLIIKIDQDWESTLGVETKNVLSTDNRKKLTMAANMKKANLTVYSQSLIEKGCLIKNADGGYEVNPLLIPTETGNIAEFSFTFDIEED